MPYSPNTVTKLHSPHAMPLHTQHGTCISIENKAVLLMGPSGCGKSDLALRLIDEGALLVGDDQVQITRADETLLVSPCERIQGMIEARGMGILHVPYVTDSPLALAISLIPRDGIERMPSHQFFDCLGLQVPLLSLYAFDPSSCAKIRFYLSGAFKT